MLWIPVVLLVGDHWVSGLIANEGRRLQDVLNDKISDYLYLTDVRLYPTAEMTEPVATVPKAVVTKANIKFAMITNEGHEAPRKRVTAYVRKDAYEVYLTIPGLEVKGYVHLVSRIDPGMFLSRMAKDGVAFFPVTQSAVSAVGPEAEASHAPVTLVNRVHVDVLYISESPTLL